MAGKFSNEDSSVQIMMKDLDPAFQGYLMSRINSLICIKTNKTIELEKLFNRMLTVRIRMNHELETTNTGTLLYKILGRKRCEKLQEMCDDLTVLIECVQHSYFAELNNNAHWVNVRSTEKGEPYKRLSYKCSRCHKVAHIKSPFCPSCGVSMGFTPWIKINPKYRTWSEYRAAFSSHNPVDRTQELKALYTATGLY